MDVPFPQGPNIEVNKVVLLPVSAIVSNRNQPRKYFDKSAMDELCLSIETNGLLQPITVRRLERGDYELIAGERRLMAFRSLGRDSIPAIVEQYTDGQSAVMALVENLQRRDLNFFEEADAIAKLMQRHSLTQQQVSQQIGKAQSTVANKLRLLRYPDEIRNMMLLANLTERHARALLKLPNPDDAASINHIIKNHMNVEQTERYVREVIFENEHKSASTRVVVIKDMRIFLNSINKAVKIMQDSGINVQCEKREDDEFVEIVIRVPKAAVYRRREAASS